MCVTCGCGQASATPVAASDADLHSHAQTAGHAHDNACDHAHPHMHRHAGGEGADAKLPTLPARDARSIELEIAVLSKNQAFAQRNRDWFLGRSVFAINLMGGPGAGKTSLLERSIQDLHEDVPISVVEGDQATARDAERIRAAGASAIQINTGVGCHLDAQMLAGALERLQTPAGSILIIENVGNLVCPALFDLGEAARVVIFSVTEGEDKPMKYPHMFRAADVVVLSKIDLLPHLHVDLTQMIDNALRINPRLLVFALSAESAQGLESWYGWLRRRGEVAKSAA